MENEKNPNDVCYSKAQPDFKVLNNVPILEVAELLGLPKNQKKHTCPQCGKKRLTISPRLNCWRCWVCHNKSQSVLDLIAFFRDTSVYGASQWLLQRRPELAEVCVQKSFRKCLGKWRLWGYRTLKPGQALTPSHEAIVHCPGWSRLLHSARSVIDILVSIAQAENSFTMSHAELSYRSGIKRRETLAKALRQIEAIGLFQIDRGAKYPHSYKKTSYRLSWLSERFQKWLNGDLLPLLCEVSQEC